MKAARTVLALAVLSTLLATSAAQAQRMTRTDLPATPGVDLIPLALNNRGQVVGQLAQVVDGSSQAFVWSESTGVLGLGTLGGSFARASAINDRGQIAGISEGASGVTGFLVQPGGPMQALSQLRSVAGLNAAGQVLGLGGAPTFNAYLYADGLTRLAHSAPDGGLRVSGLSDTGRIAGAMSFNALLPAEPFSYDPATGLYERPFAGYAGLSVVQAPVPSPDGRSAVGVLTEPTDRSRSRAFLWRDGLLSLLPASGAAEATGVNDAGMVAGRSQMASGNYHATVWLGSRALDLHTLNDFGAGGSAAMAVNAWGQVLVGRSEGGLDAGSVITLHPDWVGGDGLWASGRNWSYAGLDPIAMAPGPMHDVVIQPTGSATVRGAALAEVRSLRVGGAVGEIVTLDLNGGTTRTLVGTQLASHSVLTGSGRLAGELTVDYGARIEVGAGQRLQLTGGNVDHAGALRVSGATASLEVGGGFTNRLLGELRVTQASATFAGAVTNEGHILATGAELVFAGGLANAGQLGVSFGASGLAGPIDNTGLVVVSNGALASFAGDIANAGELRVSAGGAANFFGVVSGAGRITGSGQARFEGGLSATGSVTIDSLATLGAAALTTLALEGANELDFIQAVRLEGGTLRLSWAGAAGAHAGQQWDLFDWQGGVSGQFDSLQLPTLAPGLRWDTGALYASGEIGISAVPEPATGGLLAAGLVGITGLTGLIRRRRLGVKHAS
ncbi:PEP-CTERM sorting domain-containing protein [Roseateles paludis]|uniref:PEP-CTERM sorting domain-containing protein n=1 Tax=Roseateles paludis TaxID=3145238 RepID=A0ABV0FYU7_9BURK